MSADLGEEEYGWDIEDTKEAKVRNDAGWIGKTFGNR